MRKSKDNHNLLSSIIDLYGKLAIIMLDIRRITYRQLGGTDKTLKVTAELNRQVEELVSGSSAEKIHMDKSIEKRVNNENLSKETNYKTHLQEKNYNTIPVENEFCKHLKKDRSSAAHHGIIEILTESIWEHIHTSLRLARHGDKEKAKLHIDIVEQGLNEISRYLENDKHTDLVNQVEQYIIKLQEK